MAVTALAAINTVETHAAILPALPLIKKFITKATKGNAAVASAKYTV
jgi:hypothetical protein